jgi:hypothetical protein
MPLQLRMLPAKGAMTRTPTDFNFAAEEFYVYDENASQAGPPTDTATAVAAAAL